MKNKKFIFLKEKRFEFSDNDLYYINNLEKEIINITDFSGAPLILNDDLYFIVILVNVAKYRKIISNIIEQTKDKECFLITCSEKHSSEIGGFELESIQDYIDNEISTFIEYNNVFNKYIDRVSKILYIANNIKDVSFSSLILSKMINDVEQNNLELYLDADDIERVFDVTKSDFENLPISFFSEDSNNDIRWSNRYVLGDDVGVARDFLFNYSLFNIELDTDKYIGSKIIDESIIKKIIKKDVEDQLSKYVNNYIVKYSVDDVIIKKEVLSYTIDLKIVIYFSSSLNGSAFVYFSFHN